MVGNGRERLQKEFAPYLRYARTNFVRHIQYTIEQINDGWVIWRQITGAETGPGRVFPVRIGSKMQVFPSRREAHEGAETQVKADKAAATRLDLQLTTEILNG